MHIYAVINAILWKGTIMVNSAITARGLRKAYGDKTVLDGIDITVAEGTVFSLLGPNGAGKTTTVSILTTLIAPSGRRPVAGHECASDPRRCAQRSASPASSPPSTTC